MSYMPSIATPTPTPFSFVQYGNIPLEGNDGAFSTSIPLISERYRDIEIGVSLGYKSAGVDIDALGGSTGTDWILNVGGAVTRVMRGLPDEMEQTRWFPSQVNPANLIDYSNIIVNAAGLGVDTEQDWFSYNVNGISGKFYLDENLNVIVVGGNDEKVVMEQTSNTSTYGNILRFTITDSRGYQYVFGGELNYVEGMRLNRDCFVGPKPTFQSAWFLKEIISPRNAHISFTYQSYTIENVTSVVYNRSYSRTCEGNTLTPYKLAINNCVYSTTSSSRALSSIIFGANTLNLTYDNIRLDGGGVKLKNIKLLERGNQIKSIDFNYDEVLSSQSINEPKLQTSTKLKYRYFLKELLLKGESTVVNSKYLFEYYNKGLLPPRFSYSRDKFGYFNSRTNYSPYSNEIKFMPSNVMSIINNLGGVDFASADNDVDVNSVYYGLLSKIIYPTGGYTEIIYEPNKTKKIQTTTEPIVNRLSAHLNCGTRETLSTFRFISTGGSASFAASATYENNPSSSCVNNPDPLHDLHALSVIDVSTNTVIYSATRKVDESLDAIVGTTNGREYEVRYKLSSRFNSLYGVIDIYYNSQLVSKEVDNFGSGNRVKTLINFSESGKSERRSFHYNTLENINSNSSTLNTLFSPRYHELKQVKIYCGNRMVDTDILMITSSNINQMFNFRNSKVFYQAVTESIFSDFNQINGYTESQFNLIEDNPPFSEFGPMIYGVPYSNISEGMLGKIGKKKWYDSVKSLKKEEVYEYRLMQEGSTKNWVFRKNYDITGPSNHAWEMEGGSYSAVHYFNNYIDWKLQKVTTYDYLSSGIVKSEISNVYQGNGHKQVTKKIKTSSDAKTNITSFFYAPDLLSSNIAYATDLVQNNRLEPIRIQNFSDSHLVKEESAGFIKINNDILLNSVYKKYGTELGRVDEKVFILQFDSYGNPLEVKKQNLPSTVYLWGYNGQYPIAKIENANYQQVKIILTDAVINSLNSPNVTESTIINTIQTLRTQLSNSQVWTYTYKPLVGMSSEIDPRGIKTDYMYDGFQRLKDVLDFEDNVLKNYQYNYRP